MESLITPKNSLYRSIKEDEIRTKIVNRISKFQNLNNYRNSQEMIVLIANSIEHLTKPSYEINKLNLCLSICENLWQNITEEERQKIIDCVNFIHQNGFIKKVSYYKLFCVSAYEIFKSKKKDCLA
jgi:hypothetical protein